MARPIDQTDFFKAVVAQQVVDGDELNVVKKDYEEQRSESIEFNLKSAHQKAQAFKAAVDVASKEVTEQTGLEGSYFKRIIVSPEALASRFTNQLTAQIKTLEVQVGKEEKGLDETENKPFKDVQDEYSSELNQERLTSLPTLRYYEKESGSKVKERNALIDTYERLRKDLTGENDFEAVSSTAALSIQVQRGSKRDLEQPFIEELNSYVQYYGEYYPELTKEQLKLLSTIFEGVEITGSVNTQKLDELIGLINASSIQAQQAGTLECYLRFKLLAEKYGDIFNKLDLLKKITKADVQSLKEMVRFAQVLGFDDDLRFDAPTFDTAYDLSESNVNRNTYKGYLRNMGFLFSVVNQAIQDAESIFGVDADLENKLNPIVKDLITNFEEEKTLKLQESQNFLELAVQEKVKDLLGQKNVLSVKEFSNVAYKCKVGEKEEDIYNLNTTPFHLTYSLQKANIDDLLVVLQGKDFKFSEGFKSFASENETFQQALNRVHADLDKALGNRSGEHTFEAVDQKLVALKELIEEKHAEITKIRAQKNKLKAHQKEVRGLPELAKKEDIEAFFRAQLEQDLKLKKSELQGAVLNAERELNALNKEVFESAKELLATPASLEKTVAQMENGLAGKKVYFTSIATQDEAKIELKRAQVNLTSFEEKNSDSAKSIAEAYVRYKDLSKVITSLLTQSLKQEVTFDGDLGEFTKALDGLALVTENVAPAFSKSIQRKLAQAKAEVVSGGLLVLAREHKQLQNDKKRMGLTEKLRFEYLQEKEALNLEQVAQTEKVQRYFDILIETNSHCLAQSQHELLELERELAELRIATKALEEDQSLDALTNRAFLLQRRRDTGAGIQLKRSEIEAVERALASSRRGLPNTLQEVGDRSNELNRNVEMRDGDILSTGAVYKIRVDFREKDVFQLQSQLSSTTVDFREASSNTQEELLKLASLEKMGVKNPSLQLWATGQKRVDGVLEAIRTEDIEEVKSVVVIEDQDLREAIHVLELSELSVTAEFQGTEKALNQAKIDFENSAVSRKEELGEVVRVLELRHKESVSKAQVTALALSEARANLQVEEANAEAKVAPNFEEALTLSMEKGLLSSDQVRGQVPYDLIVPVLLQESGTDFFVVYSDQEIAGFVLKAVGSLNAKLGFDQKAFEKIVTRQETAKAEVTQLEDELESLVNEYKETLEAVRKYEDPRAIEDLKSIQGEIKKNKMKLEDLEAFKWVLEANKNCCSVIDETNATLEVTELALNNAKADFVKTTQESKEAIRVLKALKVKVDKDVQMDSSMLQNIKRNLKIIKAEEARATLTKALVELETRELTVVSKAQVFAKALNHAQEILQKKTEESQEVIRVLEARRQDLSSYDQANRKVLTSVTNRFKGLFGILPSPLTDRNLKERVQKAIESAQKTRDALQAKVRSVRTECSAHYSDLASMEVSIEKVILAIHRKGKDLETLSQERKKISTLKAKAYDFAFQFFGLPLSVGIALDLFCDAKDKAPIQFRSIAFEIEKEKKLFILPQTEQKLKSILVCKKTHTRILNKLAAFFSRKKKKKASFDQIDKVFKIPSKENKKDYLLGEKEPLFYLGEKDEELLIRAQQPEKEEFSTRTKKKKVHFDEQNEVFRIPSKEDKDTYLLTERESRKAELRVMLGLVGK